MKLSQISNKEIEVLKSKQYRYFGSNTPFKYKTTVFSYRGVEKFVAEAIQNSLKYRVIKKRYSDATDFKLYLEAK